MEGLLTAEVKASLEKIVSHCFYANRMVDRIVSLLSVTYVMPITANIIHHGLAHRYPLLADGISDYMGERDCTTIYGETPTGDQTYDNPLDCFNKILEINLSLESLVRDSIKLAESTSDYSTKVYLENYLLTIISITADILTLVDKAEMYGDNDMSLMKFDHDFTEFGIFEVQ